MNFRKPRPGGFTLIELALALMAAAVILVAVYGVFSSAFHMRDNATARLREESVRDAAANVIRNDLQGAIPADGTFGAALTTTASGGTTTFPGYLKFTTATGRDTEDELYGDRQEVSYSIVADASAPRGTGGILMRSINRNLLAQTPAVTRELELLTGVEAMEVAFYNGSDWTETYQLSGTTSALPQAVRIRVQQAAADAKQTAPAPIEVLVPWTTQRAATSGT